MLVGNCDNLNSYRFLKWNTNCSATNDDDQLLDWKDQNEGNFHWTNENIQKCFDMKMASSRDFLVFNTHERLQSQGAEVGIAYWNIERKHFEWLQPVITYANPKNQFYSHKGAVLAIIQLCKKNIFSFLEKIGKITERDRPGTREINPTYNGKAKCFAHFFDNLVDISKINRLILKEGAEALPEKTVEESLEDQLTLFTVMYLAKIKKHSNIRIGIWNKKSVVITDYGFSTSSPFSLTHKITVFFKDLFFKASQRLGFLDTSEEEIVKHFRKSSLVFKAYLKTDKMQENINNSNCFDQIKYRLKNL